MGLDIPALRILRETIRTYQACQTYTDQGRATVFSYGELQPPRREMLFATAFRRPDHLRFDVRAVHQGPEAIESLIPPEAQRAEDAVVCWRGAEVETWLDDEPSPVESLTLESVLAEVSDLPTAAAGYVTHLLLEDRTDYAPEHRVRYHGLRAIEGRGCHKLTIPGRATGRGHGEQPALTLWIDAESHLIRRLLEVHHTHSSRQPARPIQTILRFDPKVGAPLADQLFDYEPPLPRRDSPPPA